MRKAAPILALVLFLASLSSRASAAVLDPGKLEVPEALGKIEQRYEAEGSRRVIYIQDVHAHLTAQENIAALIEHLNAVYGIDTIALEGGWSDTRFEQSWGLPPSREKQLLSRALLEDEQLTGPGYAALSTPTPLHLVGIEDRNLYEKNRQIYLLHLAGRDKTLDSLRAYHERLEARKKDAYSPELLDLDRKLNAYYNHEDQGRFLPLLIEKAAAAEIAFDDLGQIEIFHETFVAEKAIDKERLKREAARLLKDSPDPRLSFEELLRSGLFAPEKLPHYPESVRYLALLELRARLDYRRFFAEAETLIARLKESLYRSPEERLLDATTNRFRVAERILLLRATPDDLISFDRVSAQTVSDLHGSGLSKALSLGLSFYDAARERDRIFFERITADPDLAGNIAVVAGGFHATGLGDQFRDAGISHTVITPDLGKEKHNEALYEERLSDVIASAQTLSHLQNRYLTTAFDRAFAEAVGYFTTHPRDLPGAIERVLAPVTRTDEAAPAPERLSADAAAFLTASREDQLAGLRQWILNTNQASVRMVLVLSARQLRALLETDLGRTLFEQVRNERLNTMLLFYEDLLEVPDEAIGGRFQVDRKPADSRDTALSRYEDVLSQGRIAFIVDPGKTSPDPRGLALPLDPASFLFRVFLENEGLKALVGNPAFFDTLRDLLLEIDNLEKFLSAA